MPQENFLKCSCRNCAGHIEFPPDNLGQTIPCPHCGWETELTRGSQNSAQRAARNKRTLLFALLVSAALAGALAFGVFSSRKIPEPAHRTAEDAIDVISKPDVPELSQKIRRVEKPAPKPDARWNGLQPGRVTLEKTGSRLIYAVGTIRNDSDRQRFGVTVELDLFDSANSKLGSASDYIPLLQPQAEWKFRALVTDPNAVRAEVAAIKEN